MLFRSLAAIFSGALFAQGVIAQLTPDEVVTNFGVVTAESGNINSAIGGLTTSSSPQQVQTIANNVVAGFNIIINDLAGDVSAMQATLPFPDSITGPIVDALTDELLSTVISQHGILAQFGVTAPVAAVLRTLEASIDSFAFAMIQLIPTQTPAVQSDQSTLDQSVGNTISIYEQLCIPSILYPELMPICASL